jgi:Ca-activated chloride channel family protein
MKTLFRILLLVFASSAFAKERPLVLFRAELDRAILPADQVQTAIVKITLDAAPAPREADRAPVNLSIVLDRSGSMSGSKIEHARAAALEALTRMGPNDVFSLITYDSEVETLIPAGRIRDIDSARRIIKGIQSRGNTALFGGVSQGAAELRKHIDGSPKGMVHRMILLSDGLANVGPSTPAELGRLGTSLAKEGISVSTIGIGNDYNEDLMTQVARSSDGNTYFVENSNDLARIFNEELGDVLSVVAREVWVKIECPANIRPLRAIGRDATIRGGSVEVKLNQLYGGQERYILLEIEVPATAANQQIPLVSAVVNYQNVFTAGAETQSASLDARFSKQEEEVKKSVNNDVQNVFFLNQSAAAKDEAIVLYEKGDKEKAIEVLRVNSQQLEAAAIAYDLDELKAESSNLGRQSEMLRREGLSAPNRKELRTEAAQEIQQQGSKLRYEKK